MAVTTLQQPLLRRVVHSKYIDVFGVILVLGISICRKFYETIYYQGGIVFNIPPSQLISYVQKGAFPIGLLSTLGAVVSLLAARMIVKQKNLGNIIGVFTTVNSGIIDYLFGNHSAIITYPLTFAIAIFASKKWYEGEKIKSADTRYYLLILTAFIVAYTLVFLGFYWFGSGIDSSLFKHSVALIFAISLVGNVSTVFKYEQTFLTWSFYNLAQIVKNAIQGNLANVIKHLFYISNSVLTFFDWRMNGDVKK